MPHRHSPVRLLATIGVVALTLAACSPPAPMLQEPPVRPSHPPTAGLDEFYDQEIDWISCGRDFECGHVTVPIDYDDPDGGTIDLELKKYGLASASGMVLVNPGGPGGSGVELVEFAPQVFTSELRQAREIVGFDPRGVGGSAPITCYDDAELDEWYAALYDVETEEGWEEYLGAITDYYDACAKNNPSTFGHVDTISSAKDMDIIRAALGQEKLDYLGFSYGTKLGATYADMFGPNVGAFVLDGAVDLSLSGSDLSRGQLHGFERSYRVFLEDCLTGPDCPFAGTVDNAYDDTVLLLEQLSERPVDSGDPDRPTTEIDLMNTIILTLYSTDNWPLLASAIGSLRRGDGYQVKFLADYALERDDDGHYKPGDGSMLTINCLDQPVTAELDRDALLAEVDEFEEISPLFGGAFALTDVACAVFPIETSGNVGPIAAPDAPTMVVVGTTGDPATPYEWSETMVEQLDDAVLLTWEGEGHTAYGNGSCIDDAVDAFLIDGLLPEDGLRC